MMRLTRSSLPRLATALILSATAAGAQGSARPSARWRVAERLPLEGTGDWDLVTVDSVAHRVFIARGDRVMVVDQATGRSLGNIPGLHGAQHVALAPRAGHGFVTSGDDGKVVMFDLASLKVLARTPAAADADVIVHDPASDRVFSFNGTGRSITVLDAGSGALIKSIGLPGSPEFAVADGEGRIFFNDASRAEVAVLDTRAMKVLRHWSIAPCREPSGLALDAAGQHVFSVCANHRMAVSDVRRGRLLATLPIGGSPDGVVFDATSGDALSANGDGTITVVHADRAGGFHVTQTLRTLRGARTIALDPLTHRAYTVATTARRGAHEPVFTLLVVTR